jgi:hypothetical protein
MLEDCTCVRVFIHVVCMCIRVHELPLNYCMSIAHFTHTTTDEGQIGRNIFREQFESLLTQLGLDR